MLKTILSFLSPQTLETVDSSYGQIRVVLHFGKPKIIAGGVTQSGEYMADLLDRSLVLINKNNPANILILGLGGGSIVGHINRRWPKAQITGVEIDEHMVEMGKKYLDLDASKNLTVVVDDAFQYIGSKQNAFDLVIINLALGLDFPKEAESDSFIEKVRDSLKNGGVVVINRTYSKSHESDIDAFIVRFKTFFPQCIKRKVASHILILGRKS